VQADAASPGQLRTRAHASAEARRSGNVSWVRLAAVRARGRRRDVHGQRSAGPATGRRAASRGSARGDRRSQSRGQRRDSSVSAWRGCSHVHEAACDVPGTRCEQPGEERFRLAPALLTQITAAGATMRYTRAGASLGRVDPVQQGSLTPAEHAAVHGPGTTHDRTSRPLARCKGHELGRDLRRAPWQSAVQVMRQGRKSSGSPAHSKAARPIGDLAQTEARCGPRAPIAGSTRRHQSRPPNFGLRATSAAGTLSRRSSAPAALRARLAAEAPPGKSGDAQSAGRSGRPPSASPRGAGIIGTR